MTGEVLRHLLPEIGEGAVRDLGRADYVVYAADCATRKVVRPEDHAHAPRGRVGEHLVDEAEVEGGERAVEVVLQALPLKRYADADSALCCESSPSPRRW